MESFDYKKYAWVAGTLALAGIFFAALAFGIVEWKSLRYPNGQTASITVYGEGEATAVPDIATVTITIRENAKTVPEAQKLVEAKVNEAMTSLIILGVGQKDQRTLSYYVNPKYENYAATQAAYPVYNQRIVGYEVTQSLEIKVRKVDSAGDVIGALGGINITEISGPAYTVDDMDKVQAEAKEKAIAEAKEKAKATARALGANLGAVLQFNEDNSGYYPMYARDMMSTQAYGKGAAEMAPVPATLPTGENVIKSRVTITYTLR